MHSYICVNSSWFDISKLWEWIKQTRFAHWRSVLPKRFSIWSLAALSVSSNPWITGQYFWLMPSTPSFNWVLFILLKDASDNGVLPSCSAFLEFFLPCEACVLWLMELFCDFCLMLSDGFGHIDQLLYIFVMHSLWQSNSSNRQRYPNTKSIFEIV